MNSIKNARLYIFDMDGTLLDSMGEWTHLGRNYLLSKGITPPADLEETIDAMTMDESAAYFQTLGIHGDISTINREIMEIDPPVLPVSDSTKARYQRAVTGTVHKKGQYPLRFNNI